VLSSPKAVTVSSIVIVEGSPTPVVINPMMSGLANVTHKSALRNYYHLFAVRSHEKVVHCIVLEFTEAWGTRFDLRHPSFSSTLQSF
jgi:hypothetical protein